MAKVIGIDLGTTNSAMAVLEGGEPTIIINAEGDRTTPSVVAFRKDGERIVGKAAKNQAVTNPENTIKSIKRFIGRKFEETASRAQDRRLQGREGQGRPRDRRDRGQGLHARGDLGDGPAEAQGRRREVPRRDRSRRPSSPSRRTSTTCSARPPRTPARSPASRSCASSTSRPRPRWRTASTRAHKEQTVLVFDLGGGTFDVSVLEIGDGVFEVKSTNGDNHLGGDDWDQRVIDWLADKFKADHGIDLRADKMALQRLKEAAEKAKMELSTDADHADQPAVHHRRRVRARSTSTTTLTRAEFEKITSDLLDRCQASRSSRR